VLVQGAIYKSGISPKGDLRHILLWDMPPGLSVKGSYHYGCKESGGLILYHNRDPQPGCPAQRAMAHKTTSRLVAFIRA
jgi:hypothetical protein